MTITFTVLDKVFYDDVNGLPLANGTAYFGEEYRDPEKHPKVPYSNTSYTTSISATQTLTSAGKISGNIYLNGNYSLAVYDEYGARQIYITSMRDGFGQPGNETPFLYNGEPVALGTVYFGEPNLDPVIYPKSPYHNSALTVKAKAAQKLTTAGKYQFPLYFDAGLYTYELYDVDGNLLESSYIMGAEAKEWRWHFTKSWSGPDVALGEVELMTEIGGDDITTPSTTISASSWPGSNATKPQNAVNNIFDGSLRYESDNEQDVTLKITLPSYASIIQYAITPYNTLNSHPEYWTFEFKNTAGDWVAIDTRSNWRTWDSFETVAFVNGDRNATYYLNNFNDATSLTADETGKQTLTITGDVVLDTAIKKFGGASVTGNSDSTQDYIETSYDRHLSIPEYRGFTYAQWFRVSRTSGATQFPFLAIYTSANFGILLSAKETSGQFKVHVAQSLNAPTYNDQTTINYNYEEWHHIELVGNDTNDDLAIFINGQKWSDIPTAQYTDHLQRVRHYCGDTGHQIWHDSCIFVDKRLHTANFTPPTTAYTRIDN